MEPWNAVGIKQFEIASKRSYAVSDSLKHQVRSHINCFQAAANDKTLPIDSVIRDIKQLRQWLRNPTLDLDMTVRAQLEALLVCLGGTIPALAN